MTKIEELKGKQTILEERILKALRADGIQGMDGCKKDINDLCKICSALSALGADSQFIELKECIDDFLDSYTGKSIMVNASLADFICQAICVKNFHHTFNTGITNPILVTNYKGVDLFIDPILKLSDPSIMVFSQRGLSEMDGYAWRVGTRIPDEIYNKLKP